MQTFYQHPGAKKRNLKILPTSITDLLSAPELLIFIQAFRGNFSWFSARIAVLAGVSLKKKKLLRSFLK